MTDATSVAADQLKSIIERVEHLEQEIKDLNSDKSEIYSEAKANGFDVPALKKIVSERRKSPSERAAFETVLDLYRSALGMT